VYLKKQQFNYKGQMMSKIYWIFIVVLAALAIWGTERAMAQTTTILAPDGSVTVCQVGSNGVIICV
jgi:quinol-cytochrome oxidoreductase complex cytochrome b subunit